MGKNVKQKICLGFKQCKKVELRRLIIIKLLSKFRDGKIAWIYSTKKTKKVPKKITLVPLSLDRFDLSDRELVELQCLAKHYLKHEFNYLGSGWTSVNCDLNDSTENYHKINWHLDITSGYEFNRELPSYLIRKDIPTGVDIKGAWEFSRMQYLPQLAILALHIEDLRGVVISEYINQIYDFASANRIGFGVNWVSPMDVAIRGSNILLAYSILSKIYSFDDDFELFLAKLLYNHYSFVITNLERSITGMKNGNHYFADLCGLLFLGSSICGKTIDKQRKFILTEAEYELNHQFFNDGGSIEFSTAYTRLTGEIAAYVMFQLLEQSNDVSGSLVNKVYNVYQFVSETIRLNNDILQVGDNDNGCFFNLSPTVIDGELAPLKENAAVKALNALFDGDSSNPYCGIIYKPYHKKCLTEKRHVHLKQYPDFERKYNVTTRIECSVDVEKESHRIFDEFGLIVYGKETKVYVRIPVDLSKGITAHAHNDFLHFEISKTNANLYADQGSGCYSSNLDIRYLFRSNKAHNIPYTGFEYNKMNSIWGLSLCCDGGVSKISDREIEMWVSYEGIVHVRTIQIASTLIQIEDVSNFEFQYDCTDFQYLSNGYGHISENQF